MRTAQAQGGTDTDIYNAVKWHVKSRRRRELTEYFRANYAKPEDSEESEPELESSESRDASFEGAAAAKPLEQQVKMRFRKVNLRCSYRIRYSDHLHRKECRTN